MPSRLVVVSRGVLVSAVVAYIAIAAGFVSIIRIQHTNTETIKRNKAAVQYICSTTGVLDQLVVAAANSIQSAIDGGVYDRFVRTGNLTEKDVDAAKKLLVNYKAAHVRLSDRTKCR